MKLNHLRDVIAVAEQGSLRAAARHLGVTQPAISRSIRELEQELGVGLFDRRATSSVLTPMGEAFLRRATAVQAELRRAREEIDQLRGLGTGTVSIGLSTVPHIALLPKALPAFRRHYGDVQLTITEGLLPSCEGALREGAMDFYVGPLAEAPRSQAFLVEELFTNTRLVFGRKGHPLAMSRSLRDLADARWISTAVTLNDAAELDPVFQAHALPSPRIDVRATSALAMITAASSTDLLMMLPEQWSSFPLVENLLTPFDLQERLSAATICLVRHDHFPLTPAAQFLSDQFRRAGEQHARMRDG